MTWLLLTWAAVLVAFVGGCGWGSASTRRRAEEERREALYRAERRSRLPETWRSGHGW